MKFTEFYEAYSFLDFHPIFQNKHGIGHLSDSLDISVVKVNPANDTVEEDQSLNTAVRVWLECGEHTEEYGYTHDYDLDCGGETFEKAIVELANLVFEKHGDYEEPEVTDEDMEKAKAFFDRIKENSK